MKKALYYAIRVKTTYPHVIAVTSEKKCSWSTDRWYGRRFGHDEATHGTMDQLRGRFETAEQAEAMRAKVAELDKRTDALVDHVASAQRMFRAYETNAMNALFAGNEPGPAPFVHYASSDEGPILDIDTKNGGVIIINPEKR